MLHTQNQGTIVPAASAVSEGARLLQSRVEAVIGISDPTRKWLIALAMLHDLRQYANTAYWDIKEAGYPIKDHDAELLDAINNVRKVLNNYLTEQIQMSILGFGEDNVRETKRI